MKVAGNKTKCMDTGFSIGQMEKNTLEIMSKIKNTVTEFIHMLMVQLMMDNGKMESNMEKAVDVVRCAFMKMENR